MIKKNITLRIDPDLQDKAKDNGINVSKVLDTALREELGLYEDNKLLQLDYEIEQISEQIVKLDRKLEHLNMLKRKERPRTDLEKKDKLWLEVRQQTFRRESGKITSYFDQEFIDKCERVLGYQFRELLVMAMWYRERYRGIDRWDLMSEAYEKDDDFTLERSDKILSRIEHCIP